MGPAHMHELEMHLCFCNLGDNVISKLLYHAMKTLFLLLKRQHLFKQRKRLLCFFFIKDLDSKPSMNQDVITDLYLNKGHVRFPFRPTPVINGRVLFLLVKFNDFPRNR